MTRFIPLFSKPGVFIFELDNLLETGLDGQYAGKRYLILHMNSYSNSFLLDTSYCVCNVLRIVCCTSSSWEGKSYHTNFCSWNRWF